MSCSGGLFLELEAASIEKRSTDGGKVYRETRDLRVRSWSSHHNPSRLSQDMLHMDPGVGYDDVIADQLRSRIILPACSSSSRRDGTRTRSFSAGKINLPALSLLVAIPGEVGSGPVHISHDIRNSSIKAKLPTVHQERAAGRVGLNRSCMNFPCSCFNQTFSP